MSAPRTTHAEIRAALDYNPLTGIFSWKARPRIKAGKIAGNVSSCGYLRIGIGGRPSCIVQAHRLAWFWMTGEWPRGDIDHINGVRTDNRWANLRDVPRHINLQNQRRARCNSKAGLLGVAMCRDRFQAKIQIDGKRTYLGTFNTAIEAHQAYVAVKRRLHSGCTI
jgi:hypothetical protein